MRVAAIIPAYNEASRLPAVLEAITQAAGVDEIIAVSDGSTDDTFEIAASWPGVGALSLPTNVGKAGALAAGVAQTKADILLFLDADLIGLTAAHIEALLQPVLTGQADMAVARFRHARCTTDWSHLLAPNISGQRALRRELFDQIPQVASLRFGIEMALTHQARITGAQVGRVEWAGVTHPMKEEKQGWARGLGSRLRMYGQMLLYVTGRQWWGSLCRQVDLWRGKVSSWKARQQQDSEITGCRGG